MPGASSVDLTYTITVSCSSIIDGHSSLSMIQLTAVKTKNSNGQVQLPFNGFGTAGNCGIASVALDG